MKRIIIIIMLAIAFILASPAYAQTPTPIPILVTLPAGEDAVVMNVIDGDTIDVEIEGQPYTVRYIGVDSPESVAPAKPVECFAHEAAAANAALVAGQMVRLERDKSNTDRYGRLLRYVYRADDGRMINAELVRAGLAFAKRYPPDTKRARQLAQEMIAAQTAKAGLWSACQVVKLKTLPLPLPLPIPAPTAIPAAAAPAPAPAPTPAPVASNSAGGVPPIDEWNCPPSHPIKGNANSMIYHSPGQQAYNKTKPEACFATGEDAVAAGFRAAKR